MNVLLVPAHPGFPGQIPQSRKTVVVLCCCVSAITGLLTMLYHYQMSAALDKTILQFTDLNKPMHVVADSYLHGLDFDKLVCNFLYTPSS